jgi:glycerophosphoryl diester phosphodiesterase
MDNEAIMYSVSSVRNASIRGVTAHRGNASEYPENTIAAFESALFLGVDWIELDIHKTKDNQIVVTHDPETGRVGDTNLQVCQVTLKQLMFVGMAHKFRLQRNLTLTECPSARVPLLSDVIRLAMQQEETRISIQPKVSCVPEALMIIRDLQSEKWIGFNDDSLRKMKEVKKYAQSIPVLWDRSADADIDEDLHIAKQEGFEAIVIDHDGITKAKVDRIHQGRLRACKERR